MKQIIGVILLITAITQANAQRHLKGSKFAGLDAGITKHGYYGGANIGFLISPKSSVMLDFVMEFDRERSHSQAKFTAIYPSLAYYYTPLNIKEKIYFNIGVGVTANFTQVKGEKLNSVTGNVENEIRNHSDYGLYFSPEAEWFIIDQISLVVNVRQFWFPTDDVGTLVFFTGAGIKLNLSAFTAARKY